MADKQVLALIRRYLGAGVMDGGVVHASEEGTPQGSPLSPLLSNVMLDDLDWALDRRGHCFVRYADDGRIYVASERAGQRVMQSITRYVEKTLKLRVNRRKSAVDWASRRPFLGANSWKVGSGAGSTAVARSYGIQTPRLTSARTFANSSSALRRPQPLSGVDQQDDHAARADS